MGLQNGALFAAPMPEEFEAQGAEIQAAIERAVQESEANGISKRGKEVTPWLLARVAELTAGKSLQSSTFFCVAYMHTYDGSFEMSLHRHRVDQKYRHNR